MADRRRKNVDWSVGDDSGVYPSVRHGVFVALLMDIRDELQRLNGLLHCHNFLDVPRKLERIARNTVKPKKRKK
jgi:hypothetical protein